MKGIILAGGTGSRLHPITLGVSKQLLPIYDKPMLFYPLSVLMLAGIKDILIITTPEDESSFRRLLSNGNHLGVNIQYKTQSKPEGLAQAFLIGEDFIGCDSVCLVLGDNIFYGQGFSEKLKRSVKKATKNSFATIFGYQVSDPERFGVIAFDSELNVTSIEEKPAVPKSDYAATGLYFYDNSVVEKAKRVKPSKRGELEITTINQMYLEDQQLSVEILGRGFAWLDTGTFDSLLEASQFVSTLEKRQGFKIACLEEIAFRNSWITSQQLISLAEKYKTKTYRNYLKAIAAAE